MAVLLIELHGIKRGSVLPPRVLIGRRSMNHLVIDDAGVSRMHAWIEGEGDRYYINDAGSRTGTRVNGQRIVARHLLGDEDEIAIGPAKLTFLAESRLRPGVTPIDLTPPPTVASAENGIPFDCPSCKAPLWASPSFAGGAGQCKYCGHDLVVPHLPGAGPDVRKDVKGESPASSRTATSRKPNSPHPGPLPEYREREKIADIAAGATLDRPGAPAAGPPAAAASAVGRTHEGEQICGVCHSAISVFEEQTSCPSCGLVFHADCWAENYGCSAYGCPQVNALAPAEAHDHSKAAGADPKGGSDGAELAAAGIADQPARFPWEFLLLAGSVFTALVGALTFGVPSLALAVGTVAYMARTRGNGSAHRGVILLSAGLATLGVIAGIPVSCFFWGAHL